MSLSTDPTPFVIWIMVTINQKHEAGCKLKKFKKIKISELKKTIWSQPTFTYSKLKIEIY